MAVPAAISTSPNACTATAVVTEDEETDAIASAFQEAAVQDMLDTVAVFKDEEYKEKLQEASIKHTTEKEKLEAHLQAATGICSRALSKLQEQESTIEEKESTIQEHESTTEEMAKMAKQRFAPSASTVIRESIKQQSVFATWIWMEP